MKKTAAFLLLITALLFVFCAVASAGPTNPNRQKIVNALKRYEKASAQKSEGAKGQSEVEIELSVDGTCSVGEELTFSLAITGIPSDQNVSFAGWIYESDYDPDPMGCSYFYQVDNATGKTSDSFSYRFLYAGEYLFVFNIVDNATNNVIQQRAEIITISGDYTLGDKIQEIVNECRDSSKWQFALNLYNWLINHLSYDDSFTYYGPDAMIRGSGVCDSYSKSYVLLCREAGIPIERATSDTHAWNNIQLDGEWYQLDATWDDNGTVTNGNENHDFFCLNSNIMQSVAEHTPDAYTGEHTYSCTALDDNYFIYKGLWRNWGVSREDDYGNLIFISYPNLIAEKFDQGVTDWQCSYRINGAYRIRDKLLIFAIQKEGVTLADGGPVLVTATYSDDNYTFALRGWNIQNPGIIALPSDVETVEGYAFQGVDASTVTIPPQLRSVGAKAFANSQVRTVFFSDQNVQLDDSAFDGCARLIFVTDNQDAIAYAARHGHLVIAP